MKKGRVIVIGGGAAGTMAAGQAAAEGADVVLLEKMPRIGRKIAISGKGRCNLTNAGDIRDFVKYYPGNGKFLYSSLMQFNNIDLVNFFKQYGVETKIERDGKVFPVKDDSEVVVKALESFLKANGVKVYLQTPASEVIIGDRKQVSGVRTKSGDIIQADAVIVAAGGASYPGTGSTGDGYDFARKLGHNVISPLPALVPLKTLEQWPRELQGLTLKNVEASLWIDDKEQAKAFGEMLFTHFGISGPIILTLSRNVAQALSKNRKAVIKVNLKPDLSFEQLEHIVQNYFQKNINKLLRNSLNDLLPRSIIPVVIKLAGINPDKAVNEITKEERIKLISLLQNLPINVVGTLGLTAAMVTSGGVDVKEVNPATMESRLIKGLFWAGEVLDIDGVTGGYNLQAAFATGYKAGKAAAKYVLTKEYGG